MATITYRKLNPNGDPLMGNGQANFLSDLDAVAQAISTRLKLLTGEWWENRNAGTPIFQSLLGVSGSGKRPAADALVLTSRILGTPYVTGVSNVSTAYNAVTRAFSFSCDVQTQFGALAISNVPSIQPLASTTPTVVTPNLAAPQGLVLSAGNLLSWNAQPGITSWNVKRSLMTGKGYSTIATVSGLSYTDPNPPAGVTSYYVITGISQGMETPNSNEVNTSLVNLLLSPNDLTQGLLWSLSPGVSVTGTNTVQCAAAAGTGVFQRNIAVMANTSYTASVVLSGSAAAGNVYLFVSDPNFNYLAGTATTPLTTSLQTLSFTFNSGSNTNLIWQLGGDTGTEGLTLTVEGCSLSGPPPGTPATPTGVSIANATQVGASLTWTAVSGASSYNVKRSTTSGLAYSFVTVGTVTSPSFTDASANVAIGTTLFYEVTAISYGAESAPSSQVSIATVASVPLNILPNSADITNPTWSTSSGVTAVAEYSLQCASSGGSGLFTAVAVTANVSYTATATVSGTGSVSLAIYDPNFNYVAYAPAVELAGGSHTFSFTFSSGSNTSVNFKLDIGADAAGQVLTVGNLAVLTQITVASSAATQIYNDMGSPNEAEPHGLPSSYGLYNGGEVSMGNSPAGNTAAEWWGGLYVSASGSTATNTLVNVKNCTMLWLRQSTGQWQLGSQTNSFTGDYYPENFQGNSTGSISFTTQSDGTLAFATTAGSVAHFYGPWPRVSIDPNDVAGIITYCEARLVLANPAGTDDRANAQFLLDFGGDYYPAPESAGILNNPGIGGGKFKFVENTWRSFCMTTMTQAQLAQYPPPVNFTGINA